MPDRSVTHSTFVIERHYPAAPDRVFAAFSDPAKKSRWYLEGRSLDVEEYQLDFRPGGAELVRYRFKEGTPFPGVELVNRTVYQDIRPGNRIVFAYTMTMGGNTFSASLATVELLPSDSGTTLIFTEQAAFFEGADGPQMRREGWAKLLDQVSAAL